MRWERRTLRNLSERNTAEKNRSQESMRVTKGTVGTKETLWINNTDWDEILTSKNSDTILFTLYLNTIQSKLLYRSKSILFDLAPKFQVTSVLHTRALIYSPTILWPMPTPLHRHKPFLSTRRTQNCFLQYSEFILLEFKCKDCTFFQEVKWKSKYLNSFWNPEMNMLEHLSF